MSQSAQIKLPAKIAKVFSPARGEVDYRYLYGGRASGKSFSAALMAAIFGYAEKLRILCCRELQISIKESFHAELKRAIQSQPWLEAHYDVGIDYIRGKNGTGFIFRGLRHNMAAIKSLSGIDLCIVEEAEDVPEESWQYLLPTIREPKSEVWIVWNPKAENSPVDVRFRQSPPDRSIGAEVHYTDALPFLSDRVIREAEADRKRDPVRFAWIWQGQYLKNDNIRVFSNWTVEEFESDPSAEFRLGADWGFAIDPSVLVRCYIVGRKLYIDHEAYQVGCEIVDTPALFMTVPDSERWPITADSARPETISYMKANGFPKIYPAIKGPKSVEEGVEWLKSFDIVVHPRCKHTIDELSIYSYKADDYGRPLPILEDKHNHVIDALRYALEGARRAKKAQPVRNVSIMPTTNHW